MCIALTFLIDFHYNDVHFIIELERVFRNHVIKSGGFELVILATYDYIIKRKPMCRHKSDVEKKYIHSDSVLLRNNYSSFDFLLRCISLALGKKGRCAT